MKKIALLASLVCASLLTASAIFASSSTVYSLNTFYPTSSPFAYMAIYTGKDPGSSPEVYINEYCIDFQADTCIDTDSPICTLNTDYLSQWSYPQASFSPSSGDTKYSNSPDVSWQLFTKINSFLPNDGNIHIVTDGVDHSSMIDNTETDTRCFGNIDPNNVHIASSITDWVTHGKTVQMSNGKVYFSQNGSANLQTLEMTSKANNSMVFVETSSSHLLYDNFKNLWESVYHHGSDPSKDTNTTLYFPNGSICSSGIIDPVSVGNRTVTFYAGRYNCFVGETYSGEVTDTASLIDAYPFPSNLYPPVKGELPQTSSGTDDITNVNWYDQVVLDTGNLLAKGYYVKVDVANFEIAKVNPFVDNLYRFVQNGFENGKSISKAGTSPAPAAQNNNFPGNLTVNFYYQYQDDWWKNEGTTTQAFLTSGAEGTDTYGNTTRTVNNSISNYTITSTLVWQGFKNSSLDGNPNKPATPQDMHHKFAVIQYSTDSGTTYLPYKLYVTSSNLDQPCVGSGERWQAGTVITPSNTTGNDPLFDLYLNQLGQIVQGQQITAVYNTKNGNSYFDTKIDPGNSGSDYCGTSISEPGIAAFVFPIIPIPIAPVEPGPVITN